MITPDDAALAASDPALPGLATVLDEDRLAAALRERLPSAAVGAARRTYARYKPGKSCVVAYRLAVAGSELEVYARAHTRESFARRLANHRYRDASRPRHPGLVGAPPDGHIVTLTDDAVFVRPFTADRRLEALSQLGESATRERFLAELCPGRPALWEATIDCLRYVPELRFIARLLVGGRPEAVLKVHRARAYARAAAAAATFQRSQALRIPRPLGISRRWSATALEWLPGRRLDEAMSEPRFDPGDLAPVGATLSELHAQPAGGLTVRDPSTRAGSLASRAAWIGRVREDLADRATHLAARAEGKLRKRHRSSAIHGDFSPAQVLIEGSSISFIDFDGACWGDPANDLGSFLATLERRVMNRVLSRERAEALKVSLLRGYTKHASVDPARLDLWTGAELLRRAHGVFRRSEPGWRDRLAAIVSRAEQLIE